MHGESPGAGKRARIEIIPLIDIIFFLLATFIMVSLSMTKNQGIKVALPHVVTAGPIGTQAELDKAVTISVNEKGEIHYNKEKVTMVQLLAKIKALKATVKEPKIIINEDAAGGYKNASAVLVELSKMGISKVLFDTEKD